VWVHRKLKRKNPGGPGFDHGAKVGLEPPRFQGLRILSPEVRELVAVEAYVLNGLLVGY
jgi:hypothetical protein